MTDSPNTAGHPKALPLALMRVWKRLQPTPTRRLNLALQGGGAHGAFTWGVLDALLDQPGLEIEGLSGSSAGAMNAVVFAGLRNHCPFKLFVGTTQANRGKLRLFRENELTVDVLLASACLPRIHHSVEIDGEPYWDGGYSANPAVFPLIYDCVSRDVLLVLLNPLRHESTPHTKDEIEARIGELSFSANFMREMRTIAIATDFGGAGFLPSGGLARRLRSMRFHMVDTNHVESLQRSETKLIAYAPFLELLRAQGRLQTEKWLHEHWSDVGRRATADIQQLFC